MDLSREPEYESPSPPPVSPPPMARPIAPAEGVYPAEAPPRALPRGGRPPGDKGPWGFWATLGWTLLALLANLVVAMILVAGTLVARGAMGSPDDVERLAESLERDGDFLILAAMFGLPVQVGLVALAARIRRPGVADYLGLRLPTARQALFWTVVIALFVGLQDAFAILVGQPIVPVWMTDVYSSATWLPLLFLAVIVAAPLTEEIVFRGFMFRGIATSWAGPAGAILIPTLLWALQHVQYTWYGIGMIFAAGLILGYCRHRTGSTWLTIWLHGVMNTIATIECVIALRT